ncbi:hypothetical protein C8F04DRAFT_898607, partial [Mycena alexandri]
MEYLHYEESIVLRYGVQLIGWTPGRVKDDKSPTGWIDGPIRNISDLSSSLPVLTTLRDALKSGDCKWVKLTQEERKERQRQWDEKVAAGKVVPRARKQRSDVGKKRKR